MIRKFLLALLLLGAGVAHADSAPDADSVGQFIDRFYAALRQHNAQRLEAMIAPQAPVVVFLHDDDGVKKFTLSRAEYLQQITSMWHFATQEKYEVQDVRVRPGQGGRAVVTLDARESRVILGGSTGQRHQLELRVEGGGNLRITSITSRTTLW
ncbi:MAG: DUF4440 domain-containing protein [Pseudomonadota bacterium]